MLFPGLWKPAVPPPVIFGNLEMGDSVEIRRIGSDETTPCGKYLIVI
jgi:hypothetical protein